MEGIIPVCMQCIHWKGNNLGKFFCNAFPKGIPNEIIFGGDKHLKVFPMQKNDFIFTSKKQSNIKKSESYQSIPQSYINFQGYSINIENKAGSYRYGVTPTGEKWKSRMYVDYGYFIDSYTVDGDQLDVFIGNNNKSNLVFVVFQVDPFTPDNAFDEFKVMLGFTTALEAKKIYLKHYDSPKYFGEIKTYTHEQFKNSFL